MRLWLNRLMEWIKHPLSGPPPTPLVEWIRGRDDKRLAMLMDRLGRCHTLIVRIEEEVRSHSADDQAVQGAILAKLEKLDNQVEMLQTWMKDNTRTFNVTGSSLLQAINHVEETLRKEFRDQVRALQHRTEVAHMRIDRIEPDE